MEMFSLKGKAALVVGGGSGIGRAMAKGLAEAGASVAIAGRTETRLIEASIELRSLGSVSFPVVMDIADTGSVKKGVEETMKHLGAIDILVNSGGAHIKSPSMDLTPDEWDTVMDTNLKGLFFTCQYVGRRMMDKGGSIINIASINGLRPFPDTLAYCTSKSGVIMLTMSLACDWARYGIRVNAIAPGVIPTGLNCEALKTPGRKEAIVARTPMGRLGSKEEVAGTAVFLASDASRFITGETIAVDGGFLSRGI